MSLSQHRRESGYLSGLAKYSGKTTFLMHALKAVRAGEPFLGEPTEEARILYLTEQGNNFKEAIENAALALDDDGFVVVQHRDVRVEEWTDLVKNVPVRAFGRRIRTVVLTQVPHLGYPRY